MTSTAFQLLRRAAICALLVLSAATLQGQNYELAVSQAATMSASAVELDVKLRSDNSVAALVFAIEFDQSRLSITSAGQLAAIPNVAVDVPEGFVASSFFLPGPGGRVGIAIYDAKEPIEAIPDGRIARLKFDTQPLASGFAFVNVAATPAPSAAGAGGEVIAWSATPTAGGVTIITRRAELTVSPASLRFGTVAAGARVQREILLTNTGTAPLSIAALRAAGAASFSLPEPPGAFVLQPNATRSVAVVFEASDYGSYEGVIEIDLDGEPKTTRYVPLSSEIAPEGVVIYDSRWIIPAAARLRGHANLWRSSLTLTNTSERNIEVRLTLFGSATTLGQKRLTIAARETRTFSDLLAEVFDRTDGSGFVLIESSSPDIVARSSTSNLLDDGSVFGQSVPVITWEQLLHAGETGWLVGLERSTRRRTNVTILNAGEEDATLRLSLRRADGSLVGERDYLVPPMLVIQGLDIFDAFSVSDDRDMSIAVTCITESCVFFAYASTVGEASSPLFQSVR